MGAGTSLRTAGARESAGRGPDAAGPWPEATRAALAGAGGRGGGGDWEVAVEGFWCTARPAASGSREAALRVAASLEPAEEGWKIHVSAASAVGGEVLAAVVAVLADDPCTFKFAAGPERLHEINSRNSDRGSAGKFITVYPVGDEQFRRLAAALHRATAGRPGPVVLSDRPYERGSRVHYRYGAIAGRAELGNDGGYRSMLRGPDGERVEDVRAAAYRCPPWARDPLAAGPAAGAAGGPGSGGPGAPKPVVPAKRGGVLLAGRYALTAAVRHGAKGGVFLGRDTDSGAEAVVKQARAHIEVDRSGTDARTALRHEAAMLTRLSAVAVGAAGPDRVAEAAGASEPGTAGEPGTVGGTGRQPLAPRPIELIEQDDSLFLVQERISGQPLGGWVAARLRRDGSPDVDWAEAEPLAHALLDLVERVHAQGLVLRDLSPGNVMVLPDGGLRLVDLELAVEAGHRAGTAGTPGYRAPEQGRLTLVTGDAGVCVAEPTADLFALGGLLFLLATGHDPLLPEDLPQARPVADRLGRWLALAARDGHTARRLAPIVLGLRAEEPGQRWSLDRAREALVRAGATGPSVDSGSLPYSAAPDAVIDRVLHDGLRHLALTATPLRRDRLWPTVPAGERSDPCNVQHGAAGVLALLARATLAAGLPEEVRAEARRTTRTAAEWVERRCAAEPVVLPGLHFGRSGAAWALLDTAEALSDPRLAGHAAELARRIAVEWPNPDVCHGAAGSGFLQLRLAAAGLGDGSDQEFLARAARCGHGLLAAARRAPYGTVWPVPKDFDSALAGITHLGFAHGVAGVGAFLLAAAEATGDRDLLAGAVEAGRTLVATARRREHGGGLQDGGGQERGGRQERGGGLDTAWWPQSAGDPEHVRLAHWCSGSSGVGSFLIRLWQVTGDAAAHELALAAGRAVSAGRWHSGIGACHGLAGNGEYLLDLADATGDDEFRRAADELAHLMTARSALRDGLLVLPDETGTGSAAAYGTGTAGALAFLLRLRHGGPRLWVDPVPPAAGRRHPTGEPGTGGAK
ncbi:class IV lanthionine synthetase LanL [Kitasatospora sp. NPDC052868]|uniref:class IV lanthionine synthetase LanL n=1 Tax=Kitasatospora sp. NPDC052868 TaxID=3364060 RepID=UPI0037C52A60